MERVNIVFDIETTGLDPFKDRVVAIGVKTDTDECVITEKSEQVMLEKFWRKLEQQSYFRLVGFNSTTFDIPFLNIRSLLYGVKVVDVRGKHIDLRFVLSYGQHFKNGKLEDYAKLLGIKPKYNGFTGAHIPILWEHGKIDELVEYVLQDARMTYSIFNKAKRVNLL